MVRRTAHPSHTRAKVLKLMPLGETTLQQSLPRIEHLDAEFLGSSNYVTLLTEFKQLRRHPSASPVKES